MMRHSALSASAVPLLSMASAFITPKIVTPTVLALNVEQAATTSSMSIPPNANNVIISLTACNAMSRTRRPAPGAMKATT